MSLPTDLRHTLTHWTSEIATLDLIAKALGISETNHSPKILNALRVILRSLLALNALEKQQNPLRYCWNPHYVPYDDYGKPDQDSYLVALKTQGREDLAYWTPQAKKESLAPSTLKDTLTEWTDIDSAQFSLGVALGIFAHDPDAFYKPIFWSSNVLGDSLASLLFSLAEVGILEGRDEPEFQFKWNNNHLN